MMIYKCKVDKTDFIEVLNYSSEPELEFSITYGECESLGVVTLDKTSVKALRDQLNQFLGDSNEHSL